MSAFGGRADSRRTKRHYARLSCIFQLRKTRVRKGLRKQTCNGTSKIKCLPLAADYFIAMDTELRGVVIGLLIIILLCGVLLVAAKGAPIILKFLVML